MELKVWVEGIQRVVCGVTEATTCQDVVFALAHATNKIGRFTLIERWRNNERHLAPNENPLKILMKWGEYSNDVQFILQQSESKAPVAAAATTTAAAAAALPPPPSQPATVPPGPTQSSQSQNINNNSRHPPSIEAGHESNKTMITPPRGNHPLPGKVVDLNNLDTYQVDKEQKQKLDYKENIGVVRGVPQQRQNESPLMQHVKPAGFVLPTVMMLNHNNNRNSPASHSPQSSIDSNNFLSSPPPKKNFNSMDVRNNLVDRLTTNTTTSAAAAAAAVLPPPPVAGDAIIVSNRPLSPIISNNGALVPPPYRDPPPPLNLHQQQQQQHNNQPPPRDHDSPMNAEGEQHLPTVAANQYRDLVQLIKLQREQMQVQQIDISRLDQEIEMLEQRDREHAAQMEALARDILEQDQALRHGAEQLQSLQYVEEESELMKQQEKTLGAEIALLRSKLANCETELLQCRNKVKMLVDDIQLEQRAMQFESRSQMEAQILGEMERLQGDIEHVVKKSEGTINATASLKHEVSFIEGAIADKKKQVEKLVHEMKEVNLQSLSVAQPSEEIRNLLEGGSTRPGSTRRIIGSPRQLENAVPTSKNPHGVWV